MFYSVLGDCCPTTLVACLFQLQHTKGFARMPMSSIGTGCKYRNGRHTTTAPLPSHHRPARHTPSNSSRKTIVNHSANAIGKIGNAAGLLPLTNPAVLATHIPGNNQSSRHPPPHHHRS